jgi:hypothetical protein
MKYLYVKECRHSRILFRWKNIITWRIMWKNQGLGLTLSAKIYIQNFIPKFEDLLARNLIPLRHP